MEFIFPNTYLVIFFILLVYSDLKTVVGGRAELPCNITLPRADDAITLILWYRGNNSRHPIYTVDSRTEHVMNGTHFRSDIFSPNRATLDVGVRPALLKIDPVLEDDGMEYRCRVDFRWGRTMNSHVFLNVIGNGIVFLSIVSFWGAKSVVYL